LHACNIKKEKQQQQQTIS